MGTEHLMKILAVERIIQDNPHGITIRQIIDKLDNLYGIKSERKSIYINIDVLTYFMPIDCEKVGYKNKYFLKGEDKSK